MKFIVFIILFFVCASLKAQTDAILPFEKLKEKPLYVNDYDPQPDKFENETSVSLFDKEGKMVVPLDSVYRLVLYPYVICGLGYKAKPYDGLLKRNILFKMKNIQEIHLIRLYSLTDTNWASYFPKLQILKIHHDFDTEVGCYPCSLTNPRDSFLNTEYMYRYKPENLTWVLDLKYLKEFCYKGWGVHIPEQVYYKPDLKKIEIMGPAEPYAPLTRTDYLNGSYVNYNYRDRCEALEFGLKTDPAKKCPEECRWTASLPQNGVFKCYHRKKNFENMLFCKGVMKNGKPDGVWKKYNEIGQIVELREYKDGIEDGTWYTFVDYTGMYEYNEDIMTFGGLEYNNEKITYQGCREGKITITGAYDTLTQSLTKWREIPIKEYLKFKFKTFVVTEDKYKDGVWISSEYYVKPKEVVIK